MKTRVPRMEYKENTEKDKRISTSHPPRYPCSPSPDEKSKSSVSMRYVHVFILLVSTRPSPLSFPHFPAPSNESVETETPFSSRPVSHPIQIFFQYDVQGLIQRHPTPLRVQSISHPRGSVPRADAPSPRSPC